MKTPLPPIDSALRWIAIGGLLMCGLLSLYLRIIDDPSDAIWHAASWLPTFAIEVILAAVVLRRSRASTGVLCGVLAMPCCAAAFLSAILTEPDLYMVWLIVSGVWLLVMVLVTEMTLFLTPNQSALGRSVAIDPVPVPPVLPPNARVVRR